MARYALDEAIRVYEWKKDSLPQEGKPYEKDLLDRSQTLWKQIESSDESVQSLYVQLTTEREDEMKKLYGGTEPR